MKVRFILTAILLGTLSTALVAQEKKKVAGTIDYPFWTGKKQLYAPQFVPGLNAALQLTPAQEEQIAKAREEMSNDDAVKAARGISKNDPNVTAEQREKAHAALAEADTKLHARVMAILTPEQTALIEKINSAYASAVDDVGTVYADKFGAVKADEAARRRIQDEKTHDTEDQFQHKLDGLLNASQKEAMTRAAEEEQKRKAAESGNKKPVK